MRCVYCLKVTQDDMSFCDVKCQNDHWNSESEYALSGINSAAKRYANDRVYNERIIDIDGSTVTLQEIHK